MFYVVLDGTTMVNIQCIMIRFILIINITQLTYAIDSSLIKFSISSLLK